MSNGDTSPGSHLELWIGATRTEGLGRAMRIYQAGFLATVGVDGEIDAEAGQVMSFTASWIGGAYYVRRVKVQGFGDPPDFTGGAFI